MAQPSKRPALTSNDPLIITSAPDIGPGSWAGPSKQPGVTVVTSELRPNDPSTTNRDDGTGKKPSLLSSISKRRPSAAPPSLSQSTASPQKQQSAKGNPQDNIPVVPHSSTSLPLKGVKEAAPKPKHAYKLNVYQAAPTPRASVDIIAVHDLEESPDSAWTYELASKHLNTKVKEVIQRELEREASPSSYERHRRSELFNGADIATARNPYSTSRKDSPQLLVEAASRPEITIKSEFDSPNLLAVGQDETPDKGKSIELSRPHQYPQDGRPDIFGGLDGQRAPSPINPKPLRTEPRDNKLKTSRRDPNKESIKEKASIRSSSEFEPREKPRRVNWLRDFLTADIPQSRVLAFSYPGPKFEKKPGVSNQKPGAAGGTGDKKSGTNPASNSTGPGVKKPSAAAAGVSGGAGTPLAPGTQNWMEYVESAAKDLLQRIKRSRTAFYQKEVPIVFVGYGFGGIVIQKALELAAKENMPPREKPESKKNTPEPGAEKPTEQKEENGGKTSATASTVDPTNGKPETPQKQPKSTPVKEPFPLRDVYQVVFLDTPFPKVQDSERGHLFPDNTNVRMCQVLLEIEMRERGAKLVEKIWYSLQGRLEVVPQNFAISWLYSHGRAKQADGDAAQLIKDEEFNASRKYQKQKMTFTSVSIYKHRRLARIPDAKDYIYQAICSRIQARLLFQAIPARNIPLISTILESKSLTDVEIKDYNGRTPLHHAAALYPPSEELVTILINERPSDTVETDNIGRIPLHDAVLTAWEQEPDEGFDRSECSGVIRYLMRNMQRGDMDTTDNEGISPWDQMTCEKEGCCCEEEECAAVWIRELRENLEPISGPAISQDYEEPTEPDPPEKDSSQYLATFTSQGTVSEFYHSVNQMTHKLEEHINLKTPSVYEMIYDQDKGCARILEFSRRRESYQDFRCRWIHVPANNEQWLSDLFLSMGIRDLGIVNQRHEGLTVFNRYMNPQSKKYDFVKFDLPIPKFMATSHLHLPTVPEESLKEFESKLPDIRMLADARSPSQIVQPRTAWSDLPPIRDSAGDQTIALFMPFLAYENHEGRKKIAKIIHRTRDPKAKNTTQGDRDSALIKGYLAYGKGPLHCRRTLDQYSYYMLETTERRDKDQVVYRWAKEQGKTKNQIPLLMIDQLWLWVLPDGTVITSLPNTQKASESYNVKMLLSKEIETNKARHAIQGPETLVDVVLKTCLNIMTRKGPGGVKLQECFQSSINKIAESEALTMKRLLKTVDKLAEAPDPFALTTEIDSFSRISVESRQLVEIIDIQDELGIIKSVLATQREVLKEFRNQILHAQTNTHGAVTPVAQPTAITTPGLGIPGEPVFGSMSPPMNHAPMSPANGFPGFPATPATPMVPAHGHGSAMLKSTRVVDESIRIVEDHILRVKEMNESAKRVQADLKQLLEFKQQQASGWESRYAMKLSEQGQRQNTIMLVFTVVTIIFLPLSFIASFFALQVREFPREGGGEEPQWPIGEVSGYLFGISVAVSAVILMGIGLLFYRMSRKNKIRMEQLKKAEQRPPKPWESRNSNSGNGKLSSTSSSSDSKSLNKEKTTLGSSSSSNKSSSKTASTATANGKHSTGKKANNTPATRRRRRNTKTGALIELDDDDSSSSSSDSDCSTASSSSSGSSSSGNERDENEYAPLLNRWRWHTHIPGVRRLWVWKLYKVSSRKSALARARQRQSGGRLRLKRSNSAGENWEWDYPLSRLRLLTFGVVREELFGSNGRDRGGRGPEGRKLKRNGEDGSGSEDDDDDGSERGEDGHESKDYYNKRGSGDDSDEDDGDDDDSDDEDDCTSEDERVRREVLEAEHRDRVDQRKKWFASFVPEGYGSKLFGDGKKQAHHHHHHHHGRHNDGSSGNGSGSEGPEQTRTGNHGVSPSSPEVEWREIALDGGHSRSPGGPERVGEGPKDKSGLMGSLFSWRRQKLADEEMGASEKRD